MNNWVSGYKAAMAQIATLSLQSLAGSDRDKASLLIERQAAIAALREVCAVFGDNDWPDDLYLADIIEKHLAPHLT